MNDAVLRVLVRAKYYNKVQVCKDLLDRSIAGFPPQFGQALLWRADQQTHWEVQGLFIYVAASLLRNHYCSQFT